MPGGWGGKQPQISLIMGQDTEREESEQVGHMHCYTADSGQGIYFLAPSIILVED